MNMTDVFNGIGSVFEWGFTFMKPLGNTPNAIFWVIIISLLVVWLKMQANFTREAKKNDTLL